MEKGEDMDEIDILLHGDPTAKMPRGVIHAFRTVGKPVYRKIPFGALVIISPPRDVTQGDTTVRLNHEDANDTINTTMMS
jgi:hypothetical protein